MSNNNRAEIFDLLLDKYNQLDDTQKTGLIIGAFGLLGFVAATVDKDPVFKDLDRKLKGGNN